MAAKEADRFGGISWTIVLCTMLLIVMGLSAIERGDELVAGDLFSRQLVWVLVSMSGMLAVTLLPYRAWKPMSFLFYGITTVLLIAVYFTPARNGAHRWIPLGAFNFQPSELAKLTYVMATAHYLMYRKNYRTLPGLLVPFLLAMVPIGLVLREPDLGTSMVFIPVLFAMLFAAGARPRHLVLVSLLGVSLLPALWWGMSNEQRSRVTALFTQQDTGPPPKGDGYHLFQSKQMLALGGAWGSEIAGVAIEDPAAYHLPAARTDFIFCLVGERWGILGTLSTIGLYLVLFARGLWIATATREPYGRLLAVGIVATLAGQAVINTGMTVGLMPVTGLTLPLLSYGGSSLLMTCISLGLLLNVGMRPGYEITSDPFRFE